MDGLTVISQADLAEQEGSATVSRRVAFDAAEVLMIQSTVAAGVTTDWHHNGDRHVYGYVTSGEAVLEHGPGGADAVLLTAGDFVYVPPHTIRRIVNRTDEDWTVVICFVGSGPASMTVDGPAAEGTADDLT